MNLHGWINAIAVLILAVSIAVIGGTSSALAAPSSYQRTCENISIEGNVLSAICKKKNGSPNRTSITLKGIENIDGTLKVLNPNKTANFNLTCKDISVDGNILSGECETLDRNWTSTQIEINGIENIDGVLKYTSSPA